MKHVDESGEVTPRAGDIYADMLGQWEYDGKYWVQLIRTKRRPAETLVFLAPNLYRPKSAVAAELRNKQLPL